MWDPMGLEGTLQVAAIDAGMMSVHANFPEFMGKQASQKKADQL